MSTSVTLGPDDGARHSANPDTLWRRMPDGAVMLLPPGGHDAVVVTDPGGVVWDLLQEAVAPADVVAVLAERYAVDPAVVADDLRPVWDELTALGVLAPAP